jgi:MFS family permease
MLCVLGGAFVGVALMFPIALLAKALSFSIDSTWTWAIGYLVIPLALAIVWARRGLAPAQRLPDREKRYRKGQRLVFVANVLMFATFVLPMLFAATHGKPEYQFIGLYLTPLMIAGLIAAPVGLYFVLSSRA